MWGGLETHDSRTTVEAQRATITDELLSVEGELWVLAIATAALDVYLTYWGLQVGLTEGNPIVARLIDVVGIAALVALKIGVFGLAGLARWRQPIWGPWISLGLTLPWLAAAGINGALLLSI